MKLLRVTCAVVFVACGASPSAQETTRLPTSSASPPKPTQSIPPGAHRSVAFASEAEACDALSALDGASNDAGPCAPSATRHACRSVEVGPMLYIESSVLQTIPTEHCRNDANAPRTDVKSVVVAPASVNAGKLRVALEDWVSARYSSSMARGIHDGIVTLEKTSGASAETHWLTFRACSDDCHDVVVVCERDYAWCATR